MKQGKCTGMGVVIVCRLLCRYVFDVLKCNKKTSNDAGISELEA